MTDTASLHRPTLLSLVENPMLIGRTLFRHPNQVSSLTYCGPIVSLAADEDSLEIVIGYWQGSADGADGPWNHLSDEAWGWTIYSPESQACFENDGSITITTSYQKGTKQADGAINWQPATETVATIARPDAPRLPIPFQ